MLEAVAAVQSSLALIQGSLHVRESAQRGRRTSEQAEQAALTEFLDAVSDALMATQYLTIWRRLTLAKDKETLVAAVGLVLPENLMPFPLRPTMQLALGFNMATNLVHHNALRRELPTVLEASQRLVRSTAKLQRSADHECFQAALVLLRDVEGVYSSFPAPTSLRTRLVGHPRGNDDEAGFQRAVAAAWDAHRRLAHGRRRRVAWYRLRKRFVLTPPTNVGQDDGR